MSSKLFVIRAFKFKFTENGLDVLLKHQILSDRVSDVRAPNFLSFCGAQRGEVNISPISDRSRAHLQKFQISMQLQILLKEDSIKRARIDYISSV